jgi:hypothetical protein
MLRKTLGWVDESGDPVQERHEFSYRELETDAGIVQSGLQKAVDEALKYHFIRRAQKARVQTQGVNAKSAAYELLWDADRYTDALRHFQGFYLQPSYIDDSGQNRIGRKNIPNVFFDYLVKIENRALIRAVGTLLWYSIDWGKGGERRTTVRKSLRELVELTQLAKGSVVRALDEAIEKGYIERVEPGIFDLTTGNRHGSITVYGIRWTKEYTYTYKGLPVLVGEETERFKNETRSVFENASKMRHAIPDETLQKQATGQTAKRSKNETRNASEIRHEERFKNETITTSNTTTFKTSITNSSTSAASSLPSPVAAAALIQTGFSKSVAENLARNFPPSVINRQIELLPKRVASKNPLGLLRRAIEENWPDPDAGKTTDVGSPTPGRQFAANFYAGYHGNAHPPVSEPPVSDCDLAQQFVSRLLSSFPAPAHASTWGRQFGQLVAMQHRRKRDQVPSLRFALQQYGDQFYARLREVVETESKQRLQNARKRHFEAFEHLYRAYIGAAFEEHKRTESQLYRAFLDDQEETIRSFRQNQFGLNVSKHIEDHQAEDARLEHFQRFLMLQGGHDVLDFWDWDKQHNPEPFDETRV